MTTFTVIPGATSATLDAAGLFEAGKRYQVYRRATDDVTHGDTPILDFTTNAATGHADATDQLISYMTTPPSAGRATAIDTCIRALITAGVWTLLDRMWVGAAADSQAARLNWKNGTVDTLAITGTTPSFTADRGYTGNGTNVKLSSGTNLSAMTNFLQASSHISLWNLGASNPNGDMGEISASKALMICSAFGSAGIQLGATYFQPGNGTATGFLLGTQDGTTLSMYRNGVSLGSTANTTATRSTSPLLIMSCNGQYSTCQPACVTVGAHLDATKQLALYNALRTYMTAVGVP